MNVLIVEDECGAADNLTAILKETNSAVKVLAIIESVEETVNWLNENTPPDLGFFDIQLADGLSFEIFNKTEVQFPVVFTTAYDEYAIRAFKVNSIDYILKPVNTESISFAINKYQSLGGSVSDDSEQNMLRLLAQMNIISPSYKKTILVHQGGKLIPVETSHLVCFYIENSIVYAIDQTTTKYVLDQGMEKLEAILDPDKFIRINRQMIISRIAIQEISYYFSGRYKLKLKPSPGLEAIVSKGRASTFRKWLDH